MRLPGTARNKRRKKNYAACWKPQLPDCGRLEPGKVAPGSSVISVLTKVTETRRVHIIRSESAGDSEVTLRVIAAVGLTPDGRRQPLFESDVAATIGAKECLGRRAQRRTGERTQYCAACLPSINLIYQFAYPQLNYARPTAIYRRSTAFFDLSSLLPPPFLPSLIYASPTPCLDASPPAEARVPRATWRSMTSTQRNNSRVVTHCRGVHGGRPTECARDRLPPRWRSICGATGRAKPVCAARPATLWQAADISGERPNRDEIAGMEDRAVWWMSAVGDTILMNPPSHPLRRPYLTLHPALIQGSAVVYLYTDYYNIGYHASYHCQKLVLVLSGSCDVVSVSFTPTYFFASGDNRCIIVSGRFVADLFFLQEFIMVLHDGIIGVVMVNAPR